MVFYCSDMMMRVRAVCAALGPGVRTFEYNSNDSSSTEAGLGFGPAMVDFIVALANSTSPPHVVSLSLGM